MPAGHTALGRGVVGAAALRPAGRLADDLLAWLRTPGLLERPALADRLEGARAPRGRATRGRRARAVGGRAIRVPAAEARPRRRRGARAGRQALCERLAAEARPLFAAPWRRRAPVLAAPPSSRRASPAALREALGELAALAAADPRLAPTPAELARILGRVEVSAGTRAPPGAVEVTRPQAIRARRVRALFLCGLQEGAFPAPARPEPFLGDAERRGVNRRVGPAPPAARGPAGRRARLLLRGGLAPDRPARA